MELGPGGVLNPIVSWGNGGGTTPGLYPMLPRLASHGFVVIAANASAVTGDQVRAGVDWLVQQNDLMTSPFYHKLDTKNVSGVGYSLGGLATFAIADDPRVVTIVIISGANMADKTPVAKLHTPSAYFCTDDDASQGNCDGDYAVVTAPTFYGVMKGTEHVDVVLDSATADRLTKVTTAWLRWQQMADQTQKRLFVGTGCLLCTDSQWVVQQKNGLM
jgi:esterase/lipase